MFKEAQEVIDQALGALELYSNHYGTTTKEFEPHRDEILKILRAKAQRFYRIEEVGAGKIVEGFVAALEDVLLPRKPPQ